jgi:hypothetical protein
MIEILVLLATCVVVKRLINEWRVNRKLAKWRDSRRVQMAGVVLVETVTEDGVFPGLLPRCECSK